MDLICPPCQRDACQSELEHFDGGRHDDNRRHVGSPISEWSQERSCVGRQQQTTGVQNVLLCPLVLYMFGLR